MIGDRTSFALPKGDHKVWRAEIVCAADSDHPDLQALYDRAHYELTTIANSTSWTTTLQQRRDARSALDALERHRRSESAPFSQRCTANNLYDCWPSLAELEQAERCACVVMLCGDHSD
jgi:hypothetical protein